MARSFVGSYDQNVDAKGRVSVPPSFRRVIEQADSERGPGEKATLNIAYGEDGRPYLEGYSVDGLTELHARIDDLPYDYDGRDVLEDLYFSRVQDVQVEDDGRIMLSQSLRDRIGLSGKALFVAKGSRFEIWNPETYATMRGARTREFLQAKGPDFNPRALLAATAGTK